MNTINPTNVVLRFFMKLFFSYFFRQVLTSVKLRQQRGKDTSINLVAADLQEKKMSRTEEVNKMTENVYKVKSALFKF